jgi:hypothetical protein
MRQNGLICASQPVITQALAAAPNGGYTCVF